MSQRVFLAFVATALALLAPTSAPAQAPYALTWGTESRGELGNGPPPNGFSVPGTVLDDTGSCCLDQMVDIQGTDGHSLALDSALRVFAWGDNSAGQLGLGNLSVASSSIPVQVPGISGRLPGASTEETIAAEGGHSLVVDGNGHVWAWGINHHGQIGIGNPGPPTCGTSPFLYPCVASPVQVGLNNVVGVGAGEAHSLAIVGDCANGPGDAYAWGTNGSGELGDNSMMQRTSPVQVHGPLNMGFLTGVAKMVGGANHTVALMCNGEVLAWGQNSQGQLGSGNTAPALVPAPVVIQCALPPRPLLGCPLTNVIDIAAGFGHSIAVDANGDVWFWGDNSFGQLCNGGSPDLVFATKVLSGAATVPPAGAPLDVVAGGAGFSLVLLAANTVVACGQNSNGQLGDCTTSPSSVPVPVRQGPLCTAPVASVRLVEAGEDHGLLLTDRFPPGETTPTFTPTPTTSTTPTRSATASATSTRTLTRTSTNTPTHTPIPTPTPSPSITRTHTATATPTTTSTRTPTATPTICVTPPPNMVAWLTADNTANDSSGNGHNGTLQGAATYTTGAVAGAFSLSVAADFVQVPNHPALNFAGDFSIDAWVNTTNTTTAAIIDKRTGTANNPTGYHLFLFGGQLGFQLADGSPFLNHLAPPPAINNGTWHHVAVTIARTSPTGGRLYVDGVLVLTFDPTTRPGSIANAANLRIGQRYLTATQDFKGAIDEVELFDRAITAQEIQSIFNAGAGGKCKPTPTPNTGTITISKDTIPNDPQDFTITTTGAGLPPSFLLDDDPASALSNSQTFTLPPGTYVFTEPQIPGWNLVDRICTLGNIVYGPGPFSLTFNLAAGDNLHCAFVNRPANTPTITPTRTPSATPTNTRPPTATFTPSATRTRTPHVPPACVADCDDSGTVTVDELIKGVNILLEIADVSTCPQFDESGDGKVTVNEIVAAVNNLLGNCPAAE